MAEQMRPSSPEQAPDPSTNYERSHPGRETGMAKLDHDDIDKATPEGASPDRAEDAAKNKQDGTRQTNAHDVTNQRAGSDPR